MPRRAVDAKALVTVRQNRYSVPVALAGLRVRGQRRRAARSRSRTTVARSRVTRALQGRFQTAARLDHYLELLARKPGALQGLAAAARRSASGAPGRAASTSCGGDRAHAMAPPRPRARWSTCCLLCRDLGPDEVELAVPGALAAGAIDGRAVRSWRAERAAANCRRLELDRTPRDSSSGPAADDRRLRRAAQPRSVAVSAPAKTQALEALIEAHTIELKLPTVRRRFRALAGEATRAQQTPARLPRGAA